MIQPVAERTPAGTSYLDVGQGQPVVLMHKPAAVHDCRPCGP